jgi:hypothetical protein
MVYGSAAPAGAVLRTSKSHIINIPVIHAKRLLPFIAALHLYRYNPWFKPFPDRVPAKSGAPRNTRKSQAQAKAPVPLSQRHP